MRNVCFLFGINGVGKTSLVRELAASISGSVIINASEKLREAFGGLSRAQLEGLLPEEKSRVLRVVLVTAFTASSNAPLILCDTHLIVPIRKDGVLQRYERMWDPAFEPFAAAFILITAPVGLIAERRRDDAERGIRSRDTDPASIAADAAVSNDEFLKQFVHCQKAFVVNNSRPKDRVAESIYQRFPELLVGL